jgi:hypothetical protein
MADEARTLFVIPAYNEGANIGPVLEDLLRAAPPAQVLVVNDGSEDDTLEIARRYPVHTIDFPFNLGVASALHMGFRYALERGFTQVVQFDGDGQHIPAEAAKVLAPVLAGSFDIAVGCRIEHPEATSSFARQFGGRILSLLLLLLTGRAYRDPTSGFRAYSLAAIRRFARDFPDEYPEVESLVLARKFGLRVTETPVQMRPRRAGKSSISLFGSVYYMVKVCLASLVIMLRRY